MYLVFGGVLLLAGVVLALRQLRVHGVEELLVGGVAHVEARLVHHGHDAPVRLVDQVADVLKQFNFLKKESRWHHGTLYVPRC